MEQEVRNHKVQVMELETEVSNWNVRENVNRNSLAVQWLGLHAFTAEGPGSIQGWGTKIPQAMQCGQKKKKRENINYKRPVS